MEIILSCGIVTVETVSFLKIANAYLECRYKKFMTTFMILLLSNIICVFVFPFITIAGSRPIKSILTFTFFFALFIVFYKGFLAKKFLLTCVYYILLYAGDYFVGSFASGLLKMPIQELYESKIGFITLSCFSKSILFLIAVLLAKRKKLQQDEIQLSFIEWCRLLIIPICMILNLAIVVYDAIQNNSISVLLLTDILLLMLSTFSYIYLEGKIEDKKNIEVENIVLKNRMYEEIKQAEIIKKNFDIQRRMTHDFKNHLCVLQSLIHKDCKDDALKLLRELTMMTEENTQVVKTGNCFVDAILNYKYMLCKKENIQMVFEIGDLSRLSIPTEKMIVILSNLLDNAIEACVGLEKEKYIKVKFLVEKETVLSVKNKTNGKLILNNGNIETNKENHLLHGYGLKNIEKAVKETGGICNMYYEKQWFYFTIIWN